MHLLMNRTKMEIMMAIIKKLFLYLKIVIIKISFLHLHI